MFPFTLPAGWLLRLAPGLIAAALAIAAVCGAWYWADSRGYERAHALCMANAADLAQRYQDEQLQRADKGREIETRYVERERLAQLSEAQIEEAADAWIQAHPDRIVCGVDADGLRIWNAANAGALLLRPAPDADPSLPGPAPGPGGRPEQPDGQSRPDSNPGAPVRPPPSRTGGVVERGVPSQPGDDGDPGNTTAAATAQVTPPASE